MRRLAHRSRHTIRVTSLVLAIALAASSNARADAHVLQANVAFASVSIRDDLLVPIAFTGPALLFVPRYLYSGESFTLGAEIELGVGLMFDRFDEAALQLPTTLALRLERELHSCCAKIGTSRRSVFSWSSTASWCSRRTFSHEAIAITCTTCSR